MVRMKQRWTPCHTTGSVSVHQLERSSITSDHDLFRLRYGKVTFESPQIAVNHWHHCLLPPSPLRLTLLATNETHLNSRFIYQYLWATNWARPLSDNPALLNDEETIFLHTESCSCTWESVRTCRTFFLLFFVSQNTDYPYCKYLYSSYSNFGIHWYSIYQLTIHAY